MLRHLDKAQRRRPNLQKTFLRSQRLSPRRKMTIYRPRVPPNHENVVLMHREWLLKPLQLQALPCQERLVR